LAPAKSTKAGPRDERGVLATRIVEVARASFAEHGKAGTSIRSVAREADVDPALVYHYYGTKDALLDVCTTPPAEFLESVATTWSTAREGLGASLVANLLMFWNNDTFSPILRAILLIAAHDEATRVKLRFVVEHALMGPGLAELDETERATRASLVASQLMGLAFMRYVWKIEPISSMADADVIANVGPNVQRFIDGPVVVPRRMRSRRA
jgi:AcrR family transcriptional regulator